MKRLRQGTGEGNFGAAIREHAFSGIRQSSPMRHVPDDFRHLPTVDDEAGESVVSQPPTMPGEPLDVVHQEPEVEEAPLESPAAEEAHDAPLEEPAAAPGEAVTPATARVPVRKRGVIESSPPPATESEEISSPREVVPRPASPNSSPKFAVMPPAPLPEETHELEAPTGRIAPAAAVTPVSPAPKVSPTPPEAESEDKAKESEHDHKKDEPGPIFKPPGSLKAEGSTDTESAPPDSLKERWEKWGGRSLLLSVGIHVALLILGALIVVHQTMDPDVDFLPGGSVQGQQAAEKLQHTIQQKKNPWLKQSMPIRKLAVDSAISQVVLPTDVPDMLDLPQTNKMGGGSLSNGGFGLAGAGGGFGKGLGIGGANGMVFGPLFGLNIKARKLAVVLDVSTSMAPHLERVVGEVDKVAKGSVVVLYYGCGLAAPPKERLSGANLYRTSSIEFEKFWRQDGITVADSAKFKIDPKVPIRMESIFRMLSKRPQTYFVHNVGLGYTWLALLSEEVRNADGLYWFSDFQDSVEFKQASIVLDNLKRRKQRLYIHSYRQGPYFEFVKNQIVVPTQGDSYVEEN